MTKQTRAFQKERRRVLRSRHGLERELCRLISVTVFKMIAVHLTGGTMHPPAFLMSHMLSDWQECFLEVKCQRCRGRGSLSSVKGLMRWHGNASFSAVLNRLRCKFCKRKPSFVYLCASRSRTAGEGCQADWALELLAQPSPVESV
jgi:hypothetical protein